MATSGTSQKILFGSTDLSTFLSDVQVAGEMGLEDSTTLGDTGHEFTPTIENGTLSLTGFFSGGSGEEYAILTAALGSANGEVVTYFPAGYATIGNRASLFKTRSQNYQVGGAVAGLVGIAATLQTDGGFDHGVVLHAFAAETGTTAGASVDNGAASANGGVGNLHASAFSGTSVTPKIQHSVDDAVWVDLVAFAAVSGATSEQVTVAAGTTVNRYLRETRTGTFTSCTFAVSFSRR